MPCVELPKLPVPQLPSPFTIAIALPTASFDFSLCCKLLPFAIATPPIPIPPIVLNPAVIAALNAGVATVIGYINSLAVPCPLEAAA